MADSNGVVKGTLPFSFFKKIPKVELHAHINGSISAETIEKLIQRKAACANLNNKVSQWETTIRKGDKRSLQEGLAMFGIIYQLVDDNSTVFHVTKSVIEDFAEDNVRYLELRSTPRANPKSGMTKQSYVEAVFAAIEEARHTVPSIIVRFIMAINRKLGPDDALDTVQLALQYKAKANGLLVGIDLSGDPKDCASCDTKFCLLRGHQVLADALLKNFVAAAVCSAYSSNDFVPALKLAQENGLKLALHIAEVPDVEDSRILLDLIPDRIGHGTCLHPENGGSRDLVSIVEKYEIPIELCLTSNVKSQTVSSFADHHMDYWYNGKNHHCIICTDDKGVFSTTLSEEYSLVAETFNLTHQQVWNLTYSSINYIFAEESVKNALKEIWREEGKHLMNIK
ncbi:PREDICTED: adenosine deaminase-like protein isoform X1 [Acropora digitifera]|uniref:adenosine deaminase-like protein isoform X1 n=1 Tax=Acropora digitifera TaxID=70779 RepID=UPI00077B025D|nr:PREDICTED: adenosine deaminase-like protein isoform X1 [Acropora digitifera]